MKKHLLFTLIAAAAICLVMTVTAFADSTPINIGDKVKCSMTENGGDSNVFEYSITLPKSGELEIDINSNIDYSIGYRSPVKISQAASALPKAALLPKDI